MRERGTGSKEDINEEIEQGKNVKKGEQKEEEAQYDGVNRERDALYCEGVELSWEKSRM